MKIAVIYESAICGGMDRLLIHLIKNWPEKNADWRILCHPSNSGLGLLISELSPAVKVRTFFRGGRISDFLSRKIKIYFIFNLFIVYIYFFFRFLIMRPDLVYLHQGGYPGSYLTHVAGLAAKASGVKKRIIGLQNLPATKNMPKLVAKFTDALVNNYATVIILAAESTRQVYLKDTSLAERKIRIIAEGVDANLSGKKFLNSNGMVNVGIIASFEKRKGHLVLFKAVKRLKGRFIFKIHCFGQPEFGEYQNLKKYIEEEGLEDLVVWHGYEREMDRLYGPLDIIVQPSIEFESMPLVPIDAAAYFKPVIASRFQGLKDIIEDGKTGFLFDVGDDRSLAAYLEVLLNDPKKRQEMGEAARIRYENNFRAEKMAQRYLEVFNN